MKHFPTYPSLVNHQACSYLVLVGQEYQIQSSSSFSWPTGSMPAATGTEKGEVEGVTTLPGLHQDQQLEELLLDEMKKEK